MLLGYIAGAAVWESLEVLLKAQCVEEARGTGAGMGSSKSDWHSG